MTNRKFNFDERPVTTVRPAVKPKPSIAPQRDFGGVLRRTDTLSVTGYREIRMEVADVVPEVDGYEAGTRLEVRYRVPPKWPYSFLFMGLGPPNAPGSSVFVRIDTGTWMQIECTATFDER